jgi:hypothetical protein
VSPAGPSLLCDTGWITDLLGQLELFSLGAFVEKLAERFIVIRTDKPGGGMSDRIGLDLSFEGQVAAALAVADAVGASRFASSVPRRAVSSPRHRGDVPGSGGGARLVWNVCQRQGSGAR